MIECFRTSGKGVMERINGRIVSAGVTVDDVTTPGRSVSARENAYKGQVKLATELGQLMNGELKTLAQA